jgi:tetratricopeptide (TPR) repeat protein
MTQPDLRAPRLLGLYQEFLQSKSSAGFIGSVTAGYTAPALERLVLSRDRATRRAAVLALGLTADYTANMPLGRALSDEDRLVRMLAENGSRAIRTRQGNAAQRQMIERMIRLNRSGEFAAVVAEAGAFLHRASWIAEAWNQRGLAYFDQNRYEAALADFNQTLELNAYHFDAAVGQGECHLRRNRPAAALACWERALKLNPNLEGVRAQVYALRRAGIQT